MKVMVVSHLFEVRVKNELVDVTATTTKNRILSRKHKRGFFFALKIQQQIFRFRCHDQPDMND